MREKSLPTNLNELMGSTMGEKMEAGKTKMTMDDLPDVLGDKMPSIEHTRVGKLRLINALQQRFGDGWKNVPGISDLMSQFEKDLNVAHVVRMNKE